MLPENPRELSLLIESIESRWWLAMYRSCPEDFRNQYGVACEEMQHADYFAIPGIDVLAFNRVVLLGLKSEATMIHIEAIKERFRQAGARRFFVQVSPHALPDTLEDMLTEAGFRHYNNWAKWVMPLNKEWKESDGVQITKIQPGMEKPFGEIVVSSFNFDPHVAVLASTGIGEPGWAHFVASIDGATAGCAAGYYDGTTCALGWAATLAEYRGRGVQTALIRHRLNHLRKAGCTLAVLETAEDTPERPSPSYRNMERNGFTKVYLRKNYIYEF